MGTGSSVKVTTAKLFLRPAKTEMLTAGENQVALYSAMSSKSTPIRGTRYKALARVAGHETLDWDMLGAVMVTKMLEQVRSVQEVDFKFGEDDSFAIKKLQTEWGYDYEKHDIIVFKKKNSLSSHLSFLGRGVIDKPLKDVAAFLRRVENNLSWDRFVIESKNLIVLSETEHEAGYIGYLRFETKKCMVNTRRDLLVFRKCAFQGGRYIQSSVSIDDPEYPCPAGLKRLEMGLGSGWVLENYDVNGCRTLVTCISNSLDLKGLPTFITNVLVKRYPLAIHHVRIQMMVHKERIRKDSDISSESEEDFFLADSLGLPDDFIPEKSKDCEEESYEQTVPIEHFIRNDH